MTADRVEAGSVHQHHARLHTCDRELLLPPSKSCQAAQHQRGKQRLHARARKVLCWPSFLDRAKVPEVGWALGLSKPNGPQDVTDVL